MYYLYCLFVCSPILEEIKYLILSYIPSFMEIGPPVPEKKVFEGFSIIYERGGHLGHATSIMSSNCQFHVHESFHTKWFRTAQ